MKAKEIRELSTDDLQKRLEEETEQIGQLTFQHAIADLHNPLILRQKRRMIARLQTIIKERSAEAEATQ